MSYTIPVAAVSLDATDSIVMYINIYNRVVEAEAYSGENASVEKQTLAIKHDCYTDAIASILNEWNIEENIDETEFLEITVISGWQNKAQKCSADIIEQTGISDRQVYCVADTADLQSASEAGISFGKYRAYMQLHEINPSITIDDVRCMPMREIRNKLEQTTTTGKNSFIKHSGGYRNRYGIQ